MKAVPINRDHLKPCPFCGDQPWFRGNGNSWCDEGRYVKMRVECCVEMYATIGWLSAKSLTADELEELMKEELVQKWNTRFEPDVEEKPWYPDDSGDWVEYDGTNKPADNFMVDVISSFERSSETFSSYPLNAESYDWDVVVAYKVVQ